MAVITISRQFGCGGEYVAERVADKLGYRYIHKELIKYTAILTGQDVNKFDEEKHSTFNSIISKYFDFNIFGGLYTPENKQKAEKIIGHDEHLSFFDRYESQEPVFDSTTFQKMMERIIIKIADELDAVVMGRGGQCVLKDRDDAYHVRLVADEEDRLKWIMNREKVSEAEAAAQIKETEKSKRTFIKHYYNSEIDDFSLYHAKYNLSRLSIEETAEMLACAAKIKFGL